MKKITYNGQMRNEHFLIVIYHSSLAKAAVNGLRICKLRRDHLTGTGRGATVFAVPPILYFPIGKGGTRTNGQLQRGGFY